MVQQSLSLLEFFGAANACGYTWGQWAREIQRTQFLDGAASGVVVERRDAGEGLPSEGFERVYSYLFEQFPQAQQLALTLS